MCVCLCVCVYVCVLSRFKSITTNIYVSGLEIHLFFESRFIYQFWKPTPPNICTGRRRHNWESTAAYNDEGLSRRGHSEGVSRNKIRHKVVGLMAA